MTAPARIPGVRVLVLQGGRDARGAGALLVPESLSAASDEPFHVGQISVLRNELGALRGFHVAPEPGLAKLISCVEGAVHDVLVDARPGSPTFGQHQAFSLSVDRLQALYCPPGVAHGLLSTSAGSRVTILMSATREPVHEAAFSAHDPALGVRWPDVGVTPIVSERDRAAPALADAVASHPMVPWVAPTP